MNIKLLFCVVALGTTSLLSGCSNAQDKVSDIASQVCTDMKDGNFSSLKDVATKDALIMWDTSKMSKAGKRLAAQSAKEFDCDITNIEEIEENIFEISYESFMLVTIKETKDGFRATDIMPVF
jgi:hypothetical protein